MVALSAPGPERVGSGLGAGGGVSGTEEEAACGRGVGGRSWDWR